MIKITFLITALFFTGCLNKHGVSALYYSECKEYYNLQGFYHKECGEDDIFTYKEAQLKTRQTIANVNNQVKELFTDELPKEAPPPNVW